MVGEALTLFSLILVHDGKKMTLYAEKVSGSYIMTLEHIVPPNGTRCKGGRDVKTNAAALQYDVSFVNMKEIYSLSLCLPLSNF